MILKNVVLKCDGCVFSMRARHISVGHMSFDIELLENSSAASEPSTVMVKRSNIYVEVSKGHLMPARFTLPRIICNWTSFPFIRRWYLEVSRYLVIHTSNTEPSRMEDSRYLTTLNIGTESHGSSVEYIKRMVLWNSFFVQNVEGKRGQPGFGIQEETDAAFSHMECN